MRQLTERPAAAASRCDPAANGLALQSLVQQLMNGSRGHDQRFLLVVIPEDAGPRVESFTEITGLTARIIELLGTEVSLFPFMGHRLGITRGPLRYLQTPFGMLPLFAPPAPTEDLVDDGWVGPAPKIEVPQAPVESAAAEEPDVTEEPPDDAEAADGTPVIAEATG